ncbi:stage II sporulation protein R [Halanaerobacter jeridensis]|uniref:Stage II sporulation protein R n=1 Tax=Halanaerobacter jeridensis TaxID=706427 RepID=A0A938XU31_9FIRM|nr:stage II sporulation protein R [Halanaerobacter jeridensis]MBM7557553.1 stage II sporulation protein R [Halanaerobacter jeridensis]
MKRIKVILGVSIILISLIVFANKFIFVQELSKIKDEDLLRLHVVANSNSPADQLLKRKVRNEIINAGNKIFSGLSNPERAKEIVNNNLDYLSKVVKQKISEEGYDYKIQLKVGNYNFPTRSYNNLTLDAGEYQALRVEIGSGQGANWWCVLFPPLCFVDSVDKMPPQMINKGQNKNKEQVQVKFKLKFAEYLKENPEIVKAKLNLAKLFDFEE